MNERKQLLRTLKLQIDQRLDRSQKTVAHVSEQFQAGKMTIKDANAALTAVRKEMAETRKMPLSGMDNLLARGIAVGVSIVAAGIEHERVRKLVEGDRLRGRRVPPKRKTNGRATRRS